MVTAWWTHASLNNEEWPPRSPDLTACDFFRGINQESSLFKSRTKIKRTEKANNCEQSNNLKGKSGFCEEFSQVNEEFCKNLHSKEMEDMWRV